MAQSRNKTGREFEKKICEEKGWKHSETKPKIKWGGRGRSIFDKMATFIDTPKDFKPLINESTFTKYDAITQDGEFVEIKKYDMSHFNEWTLYSEPIRCIKNRPDIPKVTNLFGGGNFEDSVINYNNFIDNISKSLNNEIIDLICRTNTGIQCKDGFIPNEKLEFKWVIIKGWKGYNRLSIVFRIKK